MAAPLPDLLSRLPASLGTVRSVARQATGAAVVYIQDVHKNEEAQRRISDAVRALIDGGADLIALEGASGPIDVSAFRSSAFPESARRAADGLLADGRISGAALGAILAGREARVIGVEDPALYDANVAAVREASRSEKNARLRLDTRRRHLSDEKAEAFSPALAAFDALVQSYRAGRMGIGAYAAAVAQGAQAVPTNVTNFLEAARFEKSLDAGRAELERRALIARLTPRLSASAAQTLLADGLAYRSGRLTPADFYRRLSAACAGAGVPLTAFPSLAAFIRYVMIADGIDAGALAGQLDRLESDRYAALAATAAERRLIEADARLHLQTKLVGFALTAGEWARYRSAEASEGWLRPFEQFYSIAEARNAALARNLAAAMKDGRHTRAVLVTGGFHETGVSAALGRDLAVARFVPRLTAIDAGAPSSVLSVFCQEKEPLDRLFAGERLFLAAPPLPVEAITGGAAMTSADALRRGSRFADVRRWLRGVSNLVLRSWSESRSDVKLSLTAGGRNADVKISVDNAGRPRWPIVPRARFRSLAFNSTLVVAPILTAATLALIVLMNGPVSPLGVFGLFYGYKVILALSVVWHEFGHLNADRRTQGLEFLSMYRLIMEPLLHFKNAERMSLWDINVAVGRAFVLGADISNAFVVSKARRADAVRRVAKAGPIATLQLATVGAVLMVLGANLTLLPVIAGAIALFGSMLFVVNVSLLALNVGGTDYRAWRTGIAPHRYYAGIASSNPPHEPAYSFGMTFDDRTTLTEYLREGVSETVADIATAFNERRMPLPDNYSVLAPWFLQEIGQLALQRGLARLRVRADIENDEFVLRVNVDGPELKGPDLERIGALAARDAWNLTWNETTAAGRELTIRTRIVSTTRIDDLPSTGPELAQALADAEPARAAAMRSAIRGFLEQLESNRFVGMSERVRSLLWSGDEAAFMTTLRMLHRANRKSQRDVLLAELTALSANAPDERTRQLARWALSVAGPVNTTLGGFSKMDGKHLTTRLWSHVSLPSAGVVDIAVREPAGAMAWILAMISTWFPAFQRFVTWHTETVFRFTEPAVADPSAPPAENYRVAQLSFPENRPAAGLFDAIVHLWTRHAAAAGTTISIDRGAVDGIREKPENWHWYDVLRNDGFARFERHMGPEGSTSMRRSEPSMDESDAVDSPWGPFDIVVRILISPIVLYYRNLHVRDEAFHRIGMWIEGTMDVSSSSLWAIQFYGARPESKAMPLGGDAYYMKQPWKKHFSTLAAPLGWLMLAIVFSTVVGLQLTGVIDISHVANGWLTSWIYLELGISWLAVTLNVLPLERSDFWRYVRKKREWVNRPPKQPVKPATDLPPGIFKSQGFDDIYAPDDSIFVAAAGALKNGFNRAWMAVSRSRRNQHLLGLMVARVSAEIAEQGSISEETVELIRLRAAPYLVQFEKRPPIGDAEELHGIEWSVLFALIDKPTAVLIGADLLDAEGQPLAEMNLRPFFTTGGWTAFEAFRRRDNNASVDPDLLRGDVEGRLELTLAALIPETAGDFFRRIGKPGAARKVTVAFAAGRARDLNILDSAALPWSTNEPSALGSVEVNAARAGSDRAALRRYMKAHEPLLAAIALLERSDVKVTTAELAAVAMAIRLALDPEHHLASPYGTAFDDEVLRRELEAVHRLVPTRGDGSVFANPYPNDRVVPAGQGVIRVPTTPILAREPLSSAFSRLLPPPVPPAPPVIRAANVARPLAPAIDSPSSAASASGASVLPSYVVPGMGAAATVREEGVAVRPATNDGRHDDLSSLTAASRTNVPGPTAARPAIAERPVDVPTAAAPSLQGNAPRRAARLSTALPVAAINEANRTTNAGRAATVNRNDARATIPNAAVARDAATRDASARGAATKTSSIAGIGGASATSNRFPATLAAVAAEPAFQDNDPLSTDQPSSLATLAIAEASADVAERSRRDALRSPSAITGTGSASPFPAALRPTALTTLSSGSPSLRLRAAAIGAGASIAFALWIAAALSVGAPLSTSSAFAAAASLLFALTIGFGRQTAFASIDFLSRALMQPLTARVAIATLAVALASAAQAAAQVPGAPPSAGVTRVGADGPMITAPEPRGSNVFINRPPAVVTAPATGPLASVNASAQSAANDVLNRIAAVSTLDAAVSLISTNRRISVHHAAREISEDNVSDVERAAIRELARATRLAARLAAIRSGSLAATSGVHEKPSREAEAAQDEKELPVIIQELRQIALVLSMESDASNAAFLPAYDRNKALSDSIARGRALLVLEEVWAREFAKKGSAKDAEAASKKARAVRVLQLYSPSGGRQASDATGPSAEDKSTQGDDGALDQRGAPRAPTDDRTSVDDVEKAKSGERLPASKGGIFGADANGPALEAAGSHRDLLVSAVGNANRLTTALAAAITDGSALSGPLIGIEGDRSISNSIIAPARDNARPTPLEVSKRLSPQETIPDQGPVGRLVRLSIVWTAVGFGAIATFLGLDIRQVLAIALAFIGPVIVIGVLRARRAAASATAAKVSRPANGAGVPRSASIEELDALADLVVRLTGRANAIRTPQGAIDFAALFPEIGALGVGDRNLLSGVAGLSAADADRLIAIIAARKTAGAFTPTLNLFEARAAVAAVAVAHANEGDLIRALGDKDALYPVRSIDTALLEAEFTGVEKMLGSLGPRRTLYLAVQAGPSFEAAERHFRDQILSGRVALLAQSEVIVENRDGTDVLRLAALAQGLGALSESQLRNMIVLLPNGLGWDEAGLMKGSALDWVGFVLLRDFVAGIPIEKIGLANLGRLAQVLSTQA